MTREDLIAAVIAAPDDDGPRLVLADWFAEQGDARGELIHVGCARCTFAAWRRVSWFSC